MKNLKLLYSLSFLFLTFSCVQPKKNLYNDTVSILKDSLLHKAQKNLSERMPRRFANQFNIRWTKRLNCYPRKRNTSDLVFFPNPDITIIPRIKFFILLILH